MTSGAEGHRSIGREAPERTGPKSIQTRVTDLLGVGYPIVQAPMGWIARAQLASAVSNAGGLGIIETSSGELDVVRDEIRKMRDLTDQPFGVNIAQLFVRDPAIVDFVVAQGVRFVTTSAGDPRQYTAQLKAAGLTVFHVVPSLAAALKAVDAGVDGLVVEGGEGGGFKNPRDVATHGAAAAGALEGRRAGDRRRRHLRRPEHGGRVRARRRGRADGHAHGVGGRVAGARELEAGDRRRRRDRHRLPQPLQPPGLRALRTAENDARSSAQEHVGMDVFAPCDGSLLRRRHGGRRSRSPARSSGASTR